LRRISGPGRIGAGQAEKPLAMISPAVHEGARILPFLAHGSLHPDVRHPCDLRAGSCDKHGRNRYLGPEGAPLMAAIDPDDLPKKKVTHEIGQELALLSVSELAERIGLLKDEIARLEAEMTRKRASQQAADSFFKK
jgi:uncharacterized small protein (DUF1192 family)